MLKQPFSDWMCWKCERVALIEESWQSVVNLRLNNSKTIGRVDSADFCEVLFWTNVCFKSRRLSCEFFDWCWRNSMKFFDEWKSKWLIHVQYWLMSDARECLLQIENWAIERNWNCIQNFDDWFSQKNIVMKYLLKVGRKSRAKNLTVYMIFFMLTKKMSKTFVSTHKIWNKAKCLVLNTRKMKNPLFEIFCMFLHCLWTQNIRCSLKIGVCKVVTLKTKAAFWVFMIKRNPFCFLWFLFWAQGKWNPLFNIGLVCVEKQD